jgi:hypothetical protein
MAFFGTKKRTRSCGFAWAEILILNPQPVRLEKYEVEVKPQEIRGSSVRSGDNI